MVLKRKIYWAVAIALVVPAAVVIVGVWIGCYRGIHPPLGESPYDTSEFDLSLEEHLVGFAHGRATGVGFWAKVELKTEIPVDEVKYSLS